MRVDSVRRRMQTGQQDACENEREEYFIFDKRPTFATVSCPTEVLNEYIFSHSKILHQYFDEGDYTCLRSSPRGHSPKFAP